MPAAFSRNLEVLVFAKFPEQGRCKTRLAKDIGTENALAIYRAMLSHTLSAINDASWLKVLCADPAEHVSDAMEWAPGMDLYLGQAQGDLGDRLARATQERFDLGAAKIILIGCDCPQISKESVKSSFDALDKCDVVLGPTNDGGYYLLGLKKNHPFLFQGISWSSEKVLEQTLNILKIHSLSYITLDAFTDVDTLDDYNRVRHLEPFKNLGIR